MTDKTQAEALPSHVNPSSCTQAGMGGPACASLCGSPFCGTRERIERAGGNALAASALGAVETAAKADPNCPHCHGTGVDGDCAPDGSVMDIDCVCMFRASAERATSANQGEALTDLARQWQQHAGEGCFGDYRKGFRWGLQRAARDLLAALSSPAPSAAPVEPTGWQPIRTAPKDGTGILGKLPDSDMPHSIRYGEEGWEIAWDGHVLNGYDQPTHWQPLTLPAAPHLEAAQPVSATSEAPNVTAWTLTTDPLTVRRMGKTGEECAELLAVTTRIAIQGIDEIDPGSGKTNRRRLIEEIGDVYAQLDANVSMLGLDRGFIEARRARKLGYMFEWESLYGAPALAAQAPQEAAQGQALPIERLTKATQMLINILREWHKEFPDDTGDKEGPAIAEALAAIAALSAHPAQPSDCISPAGPSACIQHSCRRDGRCCGEIRAAEDDGPSGAARATRSGEGAV